MIASIHYISSPSNEDLSTLHSSYTITSLMTTPATPLCIFPCTSKSQSQTLILTAMYEIVKSSFFFSFFFFLQFSLLNAEYLQFLLKVH